MNQIMRAICIFLLALLMCGCAVGVRQAASKHQTLRGIYIEEPKRQEFMTCNGLRLLLADAFLLQEFVKDKSNKNGPIEVEAVLSKSNGYAQLNGYYAEAKVISVKASGKNTPCDILQEGQLLR